MGGYVDMNSNNNIKQSWKFEGVIYCENSSDFKAILEGTVHLKEENNIKEIEIRGKTKNEKFNFQFIQTSQKNEEIYFKIKKQNIKSNFQFKKDILMSGKEYPKITGEIIYGKDAFHLDLDLYLDIPKKIKQNVFINDYTYNLKSLNDPIDIISNSLCGMNNLINTCYINSSFQILIHIRDLVKIIRKNNNFVENVIDDINSIFDSILENHGEERSVINPSNFINNFKRDHSEYNNYFQLDSEMFLEDLIWNINMELGALRIERSTLLFQAKNEKERLFLEYIKQSEEDNYYEINDLFYVCFVHEKKCLNCDYVTYYFDETTGLKLNFISDYKRSIDLTMLIKENFIKPITIKSSYACQKCQKGFYIVETTRIAKLPKILIISLQKTNNENNKKIPCVVNFKNNIFEIKEIVDKNLYKYGSCLYNLFAINNHIGYSPKSGHYYSMIFLEKLNSWFSFNDELVNRISNPNPNLNNYILFYKQI